MLELFGESMAIHGLRADKYLALHVCHMAGGAASQVVLGPWLRAIMHTLFYLESRIRLRSFTIHCDSRHFVTGRPTGCIDIGNPIWTSH
jgi:hypothetical protein